MPCHTHTCTHRYVARALRTHPLLLGALHLLDAAVDVAARRVLHERARGNNALARRERCGLQPYTRDNNDDLNWLRGSLLR